MNVSLTSKLESYVRAKVEAGAYNNASEVIREALRAMIEREETQRALLRGGLAEQAALYRPKGRVESARAPRPLTKAERARAAIEKRKFARLQAAIREGIDGPDDPDFSFDKLRASLRKPGRGRS